MINLPQCVLMCFCKSSVCVQLKSQYACMPHSPTRRDPSLPGRWVRCAWVGRGTRGNYLPYVSVTLPLSWTTFPKFEPILLKNFKMYDCFFIYIYIFFFKTCSDEFSSWKIRLIYKGTYVLLLLHSLCKKVFL